MELLAEFSRSGLGRLDVGERGVPVFRMAVTCSTNRFGKEAASGYLLAAQRNGAQRKHCRGVEKFVSGKIVFVQVVLAMEAACRD